MSLVVTMRRAPTKSGNRGRKNGVVISAYGIQNPGKHATFYVLAGGMQGVTEQHLIGYYDVPNDTPTVVEFVDTLEANNTLRIVAACE